MNHDAVLAVLLSLYPHAAVRTDTARDRAARRIDVIVAACEADGLTGARCAPVIATCFVESGLRTRHPRAALCGCKPYSRDDVQQARCAVRSWRTSLAVCGTLEGATMRYGYGLCRLPTGRRFRREATAQSQRASDVMRLTHELEMSVDERKN